MKSLPGQRSMFPKIMFAEFSEDRLYRYSLSRTWKEDGQLVNFVMLNPSLADEVNDDATIRRCIGFANSWGYRGFIVTNLFALRSTDPKLLKQVRDPVGPENNSYLLKYAYQCDRVVCGWGLGGAYRGRDQAVIDLLAQGGVPLYCLVVTKSGKPSHPLYLKADLKPQSWMPLISSMRERI